MKKLLFYSAFISSLFLFISCEKELGKYDGEQWQYVSQIEDSMQGRIAGLIRESPTALEKKDTLLCDSLLTIIDEGLNQSQYKEEIISLFERKLIILSLLHRYDDGIAFIENNEGNHFTSFEQKTYIKRFKAMKAFEVGDTVNMNTLITEILNESDEFIKNNFIMSTISKPVSVDVALALIQQGYYGSMLYGEQHAVEKLEYYGRFYPSKDDLENALYYATNHDEDFSIFMGF